MSVPTNSAPTHQVAVAHKADGLAPIFKQYFHLPFIEALAEDLFLYDRVKKEKGVGEFYEYKIHYEGNQSIMAYEEQDDFGEVGHQKYIDAKVDYRLYKGEIEVTNFMIAATKGQGGYLNTFTSEAKGLLKDFRKKLNTDLIAPSRANGKEFDSLGHIFDDGTVNGATGYAGILFSAHPWWKPVVFSSPDGQPRQFTIQMLQRMTEELESEDRDASIKEIWCHRSHMNDFGNMFEAVRRQVNTMTVKGGFTACQFEDKQIVSVPSMPKGDMYFPDTSQLVYSTLQEFETYDKDVMRDARHMVVTHYANLVCRDLRKQGRITDLPTV